MYAKQPPGVTASPMRPQSLAEVALASLAASNNTHTLQGVLNDAPAIPLLNGYAVHEHGGLPSKQSNIRAPKQTDDAHSPSNAYVSLSSAAVVSQRPVPSLLRYVDTELVQSASKHNHSPDPSATCTICWYPWDTPINATKDGLNVQKPVRTTFLPLSPCGHWVHYRCLVWLATTNSHQRAQCTVCGTQLFHWEGITALTLATRTGLVMEDSNSDPKHIWSDTTAYEADCATIDRLIHENFFTHLSLPSPHADHSPDLVQCFYDVLDALQRMGLPKSRWLKYETQVGHLLWGALIAIKMRRYLLERQGRIVATDGWKKFEEGRGTIQRRILGEVRG